MAGKQKWVFAPALLVVALDPEPIDRSLEGT
jgi:hypothetical protein